MKDTKNFGYILKQLARDFTLFHQPVMRLLTDFQFLKDYGSVKSKRFKGTARVTDNFQKSFSRHSIEIVTSESDKN